MTAASSGKRPDAATYFGGWVERYDRHYDGTSVDGHALRARLEAVLAYAGDGPGETLDVGMGPGRLCEAMAARGWTTYGSDASPEMVEAARRRLPGAESRFEVADVERQPFGDGRFDLVTATGVLEYVDVEAALRELRRLLKPGGRAIVSYPNPDAYYGIWKTRVWYPVIRTIKRALRRPNPALPRGAGTIPPAAFEARLVAAGFRVDGFVHTSFSPLPTPLDRLLPRLSARLGSRLEGRKGRAARRLATQVVYHAHRNEEPERP